MQGELASSARQLAAALAVVSGGRLRLLTTADGVARRCFVRALPSQCALLCDGAKPATLLGALPGLSPAAVAQHKPDADAQARGFRLIGKSYELDVLATSAMEARLWIRGVNTLPFGSKHIALCPASSHNPLKSLTIQIDKSHIAYRILAGHDSRESRST